MAYAIRFVRRARSELDRCCADYGPTVSQDLWSWLNQLAEAAERKDGAASIDIVDVLEEGLNDGGSGWKYSWRKWWQASPLDRIRAAFVLFKKRCPPWQLRMSVKWFMLFDRVPFEVQAYYVVDHVDKRIIIVKLDGLPGQS